MTELPIAPQGHRSFSGLGCTRSVHLFLGGIPTKKAWNLENVCMHYHIVLLMLGHLTKNCLRKIDQTEA